MKPFLVICPRRLRLKEAAMVAFLLISSLTIRARAEHATILPAPRQITYGTGTLSLTGLGIRLPAGADEDDRFAAQTLAACTTLASGSQPSVLAGDEAVSPERISRADGINRPATGARRIRWA
jgi:hypothetical protein